MVSENIVDKLISELELLERHILMLKITKENQPIGIIRLSEILELPKHKVRYSLRLLEQEGLIAPSSDGATVTEKYEQYLRDTSDKLTSIIEMVNRLKKELPQA